MSLCDSFVRYSATRPTEALGVQKSGKTTVSDIVSGSWLYLLLYENTQNNYVLIVRYLKDKRKSLH